MGWMTKKEIRQGRRVAVQMPVRFSILDERGEPGELHRTKTTNVSSQGLAFETGVAVPVTARLSLVVLLSGGEAELRTEAMVVRVARELPDGKGAEYGLQFDMDTLSDPGALSEFVRSIDIMPLLEKMGETGATHLHITPHAPPMFRVNNGLIAVGSGPLTPARAEALVCGTLNAERLSRLRRELEIDFPFMVPEVGRWRAHVFHERGNIEGIFQFIEPYIPSLPELGLPDVVRKLSLGSGGLILVTGPVRSGKSTTLAAMVDVINNETQKVVVTVEDTIQYVHENNQSIIKQREIGSDTLSGERALCNALRQDPDVIVFDSLPDRETIDIVIRAAEAGCLVLGVLPTPDAITTINRIAGMYPAKRRFNVLHALSGTLRGIVSQRLLPKSDGMGLVLAAEVLAVTESLRNSIRIDKLEQFPALMSTMPSCQLLDASLRALVVRGMIDLESAANVARDSDVLRRQVVERIG